MLLRSKKAVVNQLKNEKNLKIKRSSWLALATNNVKFVRLVIQFKKIPEFQVQYESLLSDKSYQTHKLCFIYGIIFQNNVLFTQNYLDWFGLL
jgi:hypothetical protein